MQTAVINFTTEEKTKRAAQLVAKKMGISLSMVLNNYLKHFAKTKTVTFSAADEIPNEYLINALKESEEDVKAGRVITFKTRAEEMAYLNKEIADEKLRHLSKK